MKTFNESMIKNYKEFNNSGEFEIEGYKVRFDLNTKTLDTNYPNKEDLRKWFFEIEEDEQEVAQEVAPTKTKKNTKNKFYYNGELIRTSAHDYTHAVIDTRTNAILGCRCGKDKAEAIITREENAWRRTLNNYKNMLKALQSGRDTYGWKDGRKTWYEKFESKHTEERIKESIARCEKGLEECINLQVIELEKR